jgi:hypothetical protein
MIRRAAARFARAISLLERTEMKKQEYTAGTAVRSGLRLGCSLHIAPGWETDSKSKCEALCVEDNRFRYTHCFGNPDTDLRFDDLLAYRNDIDKCKAYWCANKTVK